MIGTRPLATSASTLDQVCRGHDKELLVLLPTLPHCFPDCRPGRPFGPPSEYSTFIADRSTVAQKGELGPPDSVAELAMKVRSLDSCPWEVSPFLECSPTLVSTTLTQWLSKWHMLITCMCLALH